MERVQENPIQQFLGEEYAAYGLDDILTSIQKAKDNDKIKGIYIEQLLSLSYASLEAIRHALVDFKEKREVYRCLCRSNIHRVLIIFQALPIK